MKKKAAPQIKPAPSLYDVEDDWGDDFRMGIRGTFVAGCVLRKGAEPFCDVAGVPRIRLPQAAGDEGPRRTLLIRSREMAAWLATLFFNQRWLPATPRELEDITLILEGKAQGIPAPVDLGDCIEREPVLEAVLDLCSELDTDTGWRGTATELLRELRTRAERLSLPVQRNERWPKDGASLTCRLQFLSIQLAEAGIEYGYSRTTQQRVHTLRRQVAEMTT